MRTSEFFLFRFGHQKRGWSKLSWCQNQKNYRINISWSGFAQLPIFKAISFLLAEGEEQSYHYLSLTDADSVWVCVCVMPEGSRTGWVGAAVEMPCNSSSVLEGTDLEKATLQSSSAQKRGGSGGKGSVWRQRGFQPRHQGTARGGGPRAALAHEDAEASSQFPTAQG